MSVRTTALQQNFPLEVNDPQLAIAGVPGHTKLIKSIYASNSTGVTRHLRLYLNGTTSGELLLLQNVLATFTLQINSCFIVVGPDDDLYADSNGDGITFSAFGAYLIGAVT